MRSKSSNSQLSTQITLPIRIRPNDNSPHIQKNPPNRQNSMTTAKIQHQTSSQPLQHGKICFFPKNLNQFHKPTLRKTDNNSYNQLNLKKKKSPCKCRNLLLLGFRLLPFSNITRIQSSFLSRHRVRSLHKPNRSLHFSQTLDFRAPLDLHSKIKIQTIKHQKYRCSLEKIQENWRSKKQGVYTLIVWCISKKSSDMISFSFFLSFFAVNWLCKILHLSSWGQCPII